MSDFEPTPESPASDTHQDNLGFTPEHIALIQREEEAAGVKLPESSEEIARFYMQCSLDRRENDL